MVSGIQQGRLKGRFYLFIYDSPFLNPTKQGNRNEEKLEEKEKTAIVIFKTTIQILLNLGMIQHTHTVTHAFTLLCIFLRE